MSSNPRREELKELCKALPIREEGQTINELLIQLYADNGFTDLRSLKSWNKENRVVKKGERAKLLWGKPKQRQEQTAEASPSTGTTPEDEEMKFFPLAYVFDITQTTERK